MSGSGRTPVPPLSEVAYRGVRWRRSASSGRVTWFNEGLGRWVVWAPGSDAPPLPPEYASYGPSGPPGPASRGPAAAPPATLRPPRAADAVAGGKPVNAMSRRKPMTSPYRLVPMLVAVLVVAVALWQATRPPARATQADIAAAQALKGQCLRRQSGTQAAPAYAATPVSCQSAGASVKVVAVLVPSRPGSCPAGSAVVQVVQAGVAGEPSECILPIRVK